VGRNYEVGIIKHCPSKSFVLVLRRDESLEDTDALAQLAEVLVPRPVLGAFVSVKVEEKLKSPNSMFSSYSKEYYNGRVVQSKKIA
jgi:hypothetical protein